jgi:hypothetical protein
MDQRTDEIRKQEKKKYCTQQDNDDKRKDFKDQGPYNFNLLPPNLDILPPKTHQTRNNSNTGRIHQSPIMIQKMHIHPHTPNQFLGQDTKRFQVDRAGTTQRVVEGAGEDQFVGSCAGGFKGRGGHGGEFCGYGEDAFEGGVVVGFCYCCGGLGQDSEMLAWDYVPFEGVFLDGYSGELRQDVRIVG